MRNLKKILAMVLALIMSLSLMATAGAADFPDADKISEDYTVAVDVLNGLGVFKGYESGNFEPQGNITRAEVAAIIYRIATGDVEDTQTSIYSSWGMFDDVKDGQWYAGYVNYCANAGYIKGYNNLFDPNAQVTGYQALAMILRAVGYDKMGEFTGSNWQVATAATAQQRGVLKNVSSGLLGQSATREMIAEILFRAILINKVDYTPAYGYQESSTSVGYDSLDLEEVIGVVVANEWADLYSSVVMEDGKTNLEVADGDIRTLNYGTEITDIGESKLAYIQNEKVLSMDDSGLNTVYQDGAAVDISARTAFKNVSGLNETDETEYYVNFGDPDGHHGSDYRIEYQVSFYDQAALDRFSRNYADIVTIAANDPEMQVIPVINPNGPGGTRVPGTEYHKIIPAGEVITDDDLAIIRGIFASADDIRGALVDNQTQYWLEGDVYAGTKSTPDTIAGDRDLSNELSYRKFVEEYIVDNASMETWDASANGQWVKIIDNDADGNADYAFLTNFWLDQVASFTTVDSASIPEYAGLNDEVWTPRYVNGYKPEVKDIVIYTLIDGMANIEKADVQQGVVTTVSFENRTITVDSDPEKVWGQSGIVNWTGLDQVITAMSEKVEYIMYRDYFGYVRAYELAAGNNYGLVTEVYDSRVNAGQVVTGTNYRVELNAPDSDGNLKSDEYNATAAGVGAFLASDDLTPGSIGNVNGADAWRPYKNLLQRAIAHLGSNISYTVRNRAIVSTGNLRADGWANGDEFVYLDATDANGLQRDANGDYTYTWSNVARYTIDTDNNVALRTAAEYSTNQNGNQMYYDLGYDTSTAAQEAATRWHDWERDGVLTTADKVDEPTWIAEYIRQTSRTQAQAKAAFDAQVGNTLFRVYDVDYVPLAAEGVVAGQRSWNTAVSNSYVTWTNNSYINAVHDTEFYVYVPGDASRRVDYFVDYESVYNIPAANVRSVYAVAENTTADRRSNDYWVANVIVIELYSWPATVTNWDNVGLVYYNPSQTTGDTQSLYALHTGTDDPKATIIPTNSDWGRQWQTGDQPYGFYTTSNDQIDGQTVKARIDPITRGWAGYGIHVGVITRMSELTERGGYIVVDELVGLARVSATRYVSLTRTVEVNNAPVYAIDGTTAVSLRMSSNINTSNVQVGDRIIYVTGKGSTVKYIVDVSDPVVRGTGRSAVANQSEVWHTPSWLYIAGEDELTSDPTAYSSLFYQILWEQRQDTYKAPFKFYGSDALNTESLDETTYASATSSVFSSLGIAQGIYLGNVTVSYDDAVKAGVQPWIAPTATNYAMYKWDGSSSWTANTYPGVPTTTESVYLVVMKDTGNYYILRQKAQGVVVSNLESERPDLVHVYKSGSDTNVVVMDQSITIAQLQNYLVDEKGNHPTVTATINGITATNPAGLTVAACLAQSGTITITGVTNISYGPGSTFVQVTFDSNMVTVTNAGKSISSNSWVDKSSSTLKAAPKSGYKITAVTGATGGSYPTTSEVTLSSISANVSITAAALSEQDRVNNAKTDVLDSITLNSVGLENSIYKTGSDVNAAAVDAYELAVESAVKADVEKQLADKGYNGITATVDVINNGLGSPTIFPDPGVSKTVTVSITIRSTSTPSATATVSSKTVSVMIGFAGQSAVESAITAALINNITSATLQGDTDAKVAQIINGVAGVSNATAKTTWTNGSGITQVTVVYTYSWNGVDNISAEAVFGLDLNP